MGNLSSRQVTLFFLLGYSLVQWLFVEPYFTDKTLIASQLSEQMASHWQPYLIDVDCVGFEGVRGKLKTWAEEPPVYHYLGALISALGGSALHFKLLPIFCFLFFAFGFLKILETLLSREQLQENRSYLLILLLFQPYVLIHFTRPLPDALSLALLTWFLNFFLRRNYPATFTLALLAVTTKALAIFPIFFIFAAYLLFSKEFNWKKRLMISSLHGLSILPMLGWLYYLKSEGIINPFFAEDLGLIHTDIDDRYLLTTGKYWSRMYSWIIHRGLSIPLFVFSIYAIFKTLKLKPISFHSKVFLFGVFGHILFLLKIRMGTLTVPWYAFYFLIFYYLLAIPNILTLSMRGKRILLALTAVIATGFLKFSKDVEKNVFVDVKKIDSPIHCQFHQYKLKEQLEQKAELLK